MLHWFGAGDLEKKEQEQRPLPTLCCLCPGRTDGAVSWWAHTDREGPGRMRSRGRGESDTTERLHWTQLSASGERLCSHQTDPWEKMGKQVSNRQRFHRLLSFPRPCLSITFQENMWLAGQMAIWGSQQLTSLIRISSQICSEKSIAGNGVSFKSKTLKSIPRWTPHGLSKSRKVTQLSERQFPIRNVSCRKGLSLRVHIHVCKAPQVFGKRGAGW